MPLTCRPLTRRPMNQAHARRDREPRRLKSEQTLHGAPLCIIISDPASLYSLGITNSKSEVKSLALIYLCRYRRVLPILTHQVDSDTFSIPNSTFHKRQPHATHVLALVIHKEWQTPNHISSVSGNLGSDDNRVLPLVAKVGLEQRDVGQVGIVELAGLGGVDLDARGLAVVVTGDGGRDGGAGLDLELVALVQSALGPLAVVGQVDFAKELGVLGGVVDANLRIGQCFEN